MLTGAPGGFLANPPVPGLGGSPRVSAILDRAVAGARITPAEALVLFELSLIHISEPTRPY